MAVLERSIELLRNTLKQSELVCYKQDIQLQKMIRALLHYQSSSVLDSQTITDHSVTAISRPKIGFLMTAVGSAIKKYVDVPTAAATIQRFRLQESREVKQLGTFSP